MMKKRIFKARNIQEAIASIKEELGPDAMILSTRKVRPSLNDPYSKNMFEVEASPGPAPKAIHHEDPMGSVKEELKTIRDLISISGLSGGMHHMMGTYYESVPILASLLRAGVSEKRACSFVQNACFAMEEDRKNSPGAASLKKYVMEECARKIEIRDICHFSPRSGQPHFAAFVGPTGVGKTTTIAKLAALMSFKRKMKVGLVSIDNYRIGAFEQLKAYASIMGIYCVSAFNKEDLTKALDNMRAMDVVLIDTAGHSHYDHAKMQEVADLIKGNFRISVHLVLSVTSEFINMKEAAAAFSVLKPDTYVFTKVDETKQCGKILDQISDFNLPVSLVTNGQKVPEDLVVPDRRALLSVVLGKGREGNA